MNQCTAENCIRQTWSRGYCHTCYERWRKIGFSEEGPPAIQRSREPFFLIKRQWMYDEQGLLWCVTGDHWAYADRFYLNGASRGIGGRRPSCKLCLHNDGVGLPVGWSDTDARHLKLKYKMTPAEYMEMFHIQGGCCAICGAQGSSERGSRLHVDHDHECCPGAYSCGACIRSLLCDVCNRGIGYLHDDPLVLRAAAVYIETHKQKR